MKMKRKPLSIERRQTRAGWVFALPWLIGLVYFFIIPFAQSIWYSFNDVKIGDNGLVYTFQGLFNYDYILLRESTFNQSVVSALTDLLYTVPVVLVFSLFIALLLNQKFRGRILIRARYFLPVIIATGQVIKIVFSMSDDSLSEMGVSGGMAAGMISVEDITGMLDIGDDIAKFISTTINDIFNLIWSCGIQIVLYLSGLQSIPATLYEASRVEGATKWEEFWFITFPMLSRITLLVGVFTMVELCIDEKLALIERVYGSMLASEYDKPSAMIWLYFGIICVVMGLIILLYNRLIMKRYEA